MATIKAISFDAAFTLFDVRYHPAQLALAICEALGEPISRDEAYLFAMMDAQRRPDFEAAHLQPRPASGPDPVEQYWTQVTEDWLRAIGRPTERSGAIRQEALRQLEQTPTWFSLYPDARPTLEAVRQAGFKIGILSNWDRSLHRLIHAHGLSDLVDTVVASLDHGVEKPEKALFEILFSRLEVRPDEVIHIGDDATDDVFGAQQAGAQAVWLQRAMSTAQTTTPGLMGIHDPWRIRSLSELLPLISAASARHPSEAPQAEHP